jgi:hypothetical protein
VQHIRSSLLILPVVLAGLIEADYRSGGSTAVAFFTANRWTNTATDGTNLNLSPGSSVVLTWSLVPDGTPVGSQDSPTSSGLIAWLDDLYGNGSGGTNLSLRPWFQYFQQSFDRVSALSGITFVYDPQLAAFPVTDDAMYFFSHYYQVPGVLGLRGDLRIGGFPDGNAFDSYLGATWLEPNNGDITLNTNENSHFALPQRGVDRKNYTYLPLRNVLMHETLHAVGINHVQSTDAAFLMETFYQSAFDGPQLDDVLGLQRLYGDRYEKNGGNNTYESATPLGTLSPAQPIAIGALGSSSVVQPTETDFVSVSANTDADVYNFTLSTALDVRLVLAPRGTNYLMGPAVYYDTPFNSLTLNDLALELFDQDGATRLAFADVNPAGLAEEILRRLRPGTYYARITGSQNYVQLYGLNLTATEPNPNLLPGDSNFDGLVDAADYVVWRKTDGTQAGYNSWRGHFGQSFGGASVGNFADPIPAAVPEPNTPFLLILGSIINGCSARKRARHGQSRSEYDGSSCATNHQFRSPAAWNHS